MPSVAHSLTFAQSEAIQYVQKRAMRITHCNSEYSTLLAMSNLQYLYQQREELTQWFFVLLLSVLFVAAKARL